MGANLSKALGEHSYSSAGWLADGQLICAHSPGKLFGSKEMRLLMLGLDAAGKTSTFLPVYLLA
jgi:hypothetical protein